MKNLPVVMFALLLVFSLSAGAGEGGEALFTSLGCMSCHNPEKASKVNPSLVEIAQAYQDRPVELAAYFNGHGEAIVRPEKAGMMKRYVEKTKALTEAQRAALADYIVAYR